MEGTGIDNVYEFVDMFFSGHICGSCIKQIFSLLFSGQRSGFNSGMYLAIYTRGVLEQTWIRLRMNLLFECNPMRLSI